MEVLRRFLAFLVDNIILVVAGLVIASRVARVHGLTFDYRRVIEELVQLFYVLFVWLNHALMESSAKQGIIGKIAIGIVATGCMLDREMKRKGNS